MLSLADSAEIARRHLVQLAVSGSGTVDEIHRYQLRHQLLSRIRFWRFGERLHRGRLHSEGQCFPSSVVQKDTRS